MRWRHIHQTHTNYVLLKVTSRTSDKTTDTRLFLILSFRRLEWFDLNTHDPLSCPTINMKANPLFLAVFAVSTSAQNYPGYLSVGPGIGDFAEAKQVAEAAGRHPNATSSVTFTRAASSDTGSWGWRINVTEIAVPDQLANLGKSGASFSQGLHVANTQWQLDWPGDDDNFKAFLGKQNMSATFTGYLANKPANVTDSYNEKDNGDCKSILGDQCSRLLAQALSSGDKRDIWASGLAGCEGTLYSKDEGSGHQTVSTRKSLYNYVTCMIADLMPLGWDGPSGNSNDAYKRGDTVISRTSTTYKPDDPTTFKQASSALQILAINLVTASSSDTSSTSSSSLSLLCQIVNKSAVGKSCKPKPTQSGQPSSKPPGSKAAKWHLSPAMLLAMVTLSILIVV